MMCIPYIAIATPSPIVLLNTGVGACADVGYLKDST